MCHRCTITLKSYSPFQKLVNVTMEACQCWFFQSSASDMQEAVQETEEVCLSFVSGT